jgi:hypothetical protein
MGDLMKLLVISILLVNSFMIFAQEVKVSRMTRDGDLERSYVLKTNLPLKVVLDCQSFIQGLRLGEYEAASTILLDEQECDGLSQRINSSMKKGLKHCIEIDEIISSDYSCR